MKSISAFFGSVALLVMATQTFAATPSTNAPPANPAPAASPVPAPAPAEPTSTLKLDDYINELGTTLKLSDDEKKSIRSDYEADGNLLKNILNNDALTPQQKAQQVSDLRDTRNAKIEALVHDLDRQQAFLKVEAKYRVALTELAADGGFTFVPTPAPAPAAPVAQPAATNAPSAAK